MADVEPARYFNLAIEHINTITEWLKTCEEEAQPLLVHIDIFVHLSKKYPEMAKRRIKKLNINAIETIFNSWFAKNQNKIPTKFRSGIRESANNLIGELKSIDN